MKKLLLCFLLLGSINLWAQTPPPNDDACNALLVPDDGIGLLMEFDTATVQVGEEVLTPPIGDCYDDNWCDLGIEASIWFKFVAPNSAGVNVSVCGSDFDTQLAIYEVGDCNDFASFTLLAASDDDIDDTCGPSDGAKGLASNINLNCLNTGATYYVLVDQFVATGDFTDGVIDIQVAEMTFATQPSIDSIALVSPTCTGGNDGAASVSYQGIYPLSFLWSTGATTNAINGLSGGQTVSVSITNGCGLSDSGTATIPTVGTGIQMTIDDVVSFPAFCGDGYASVTMLGGTPPYSFLWNNGETTGLITAASGDYSVTISDLCGQILSQNVTIQGLADAGPNLTVNTGSGTLGGNPTANNPSLEKTTYNLDQTIDAGVACSSGGFVSDNGRLRTFDLGADFGITTDYTINEIEIGIFSALAGGGAGSQSLECRVFSINTLDLSVATLVPVDTIAINLPDIATPILWRFPVNYTVPANTLFAIEIYNPNGVEAQNQLVVGINESQTVNNNPTWIRSEGCGITAPTRFIDIGFTDELLVNLVQYQPTAGNYTYSWTPTTGLDDPTAANPLVTPAQQGVTTYTVVVTDTDSGCTGTDQTIVISNLGCDPPTVTTSITASDCNGATGGASVSIADGVPPYSIEWSTGSTDASISGLVSGIYSVSVVDDAGCFIIETVQVPTATQLIQFDLSMTQADCGMTNGTATITVLSTPTTASITWSTGETGNTISNLAPGWYSVAIADQGSGCQRHQNIYVEEDLSCKVIIEGRLINDAVNTDCVEDASSNSIANRMVFLRNAVLTEDITFTDAQGYYQFVAFPDTYTVEYNEANTDVPLCPATNSTTIAALGMGQTYEQDFYVGYQEIHDLSVYMTMGPARPGFTVYHTLVYCNDGSVTIDSGLVTLQHDLNLTNFNPSIPPTSYDVASGKATWDFTSLPPGQCRYISINYVLPATTPIGTLLDHTATILPIDNDDTPANNVFAGHQEVTGSYDPNDKQNLVSRDPFGGDIDPDISTYHYQIRFQNTGTDTAFTVVVRDELEPKFDLSSIRTVYASHDYTMDIENGNELVYYFHDILLADSNINEPASHGLVYFTIDLMPGFPLGTEISNEANIYFDFNAPILTNTVTNTLAIIDGTKDESHNFGLAVHPNPFNGSAYIDLSMEIPATVSLTLYDVKGRVVSVIKTNESLRSGQYQIPLATEEMAAGIYFLQLQSEEGVLTRKLVKF